MLVSQAMVRKVITLGPDDRLKDIVQKFLLNDISGAPVVDSKKNVIGILSESDILSVLKERQKELNLVYIAPSMGLVGLSFREKPIERETEEVFSELENITAREIMRKDVVTVAPDEELQVVVDLIAKGRFNRVPVVKNGRLVGIVTRGDIIRAISTKPA